MKTQEKFGVSRRSGWILALLFLCLTFIASLLISGRYRDNAAAALSRREAIASLASATLGEKFARLTDVGMSLATRVQFRKFVESGQWDDAIAIMDGVTQTFPYVDTIVLYNPQGILESLTPRTPSSSLAIGQDFSYRDYYRGVSKRWEPYLSEAFNRAIEPNDAIISVAIPIRSDSNDRVVGILLLVVKLDTLVSWSQNVDVGEGGFVYVVDQGGHLVAHPRLSGEGTVVSYLLEPAVQNVLQGKRGVGILFDPVEKKDMLTAYDPVAASGWGVVVAQPVKSAFADRNRALYSDLFLWALFILALETATLLLLRSRDALKTQLIEEKSLLESNRRSLELVESANKELQSFTYSISHDLRAPLRAIDGFSKMLDEDYSKNFSAEGKHVIATIRAGAQRMGTLIDDLLAFSRLGNRSAVIGDVDMTVLAKEVFDELAGAHPGRDIRFACDNLPVARADPSLMRQVWTNLLSNAIKFTSKREEASISVGSVADGKNTTYFVRDNGVGFDMRYVDKLFGVFQRLHSSQEFEGSGIGLSLVARIIQKHGGKVWAEGAVGTGATFCFSLPSATKIINS